MFSTTLIATLIIALIISLLLNIFMDRVINKGFTSSSHIMSMTIVIWFILLLITTLKKCGL